MNLAIEFLVRTGAIRRFLEVPCSLFIEKSSEQIHKVIQLKESVDCTNTYVAKQWHLEECDLSTKLPRFEIFNVPQEEVFFDEKIIVSGFQPIPYIEQSLPTNRNSYNKPMSRLDYNFFSHNFLYSIRHWANKTDWLWEAFARLRIGDQRSIKNLFSYSERRMYIEKEQYYVRHQYREIWSNWLKWRNELLLKEAVAPELVFASAYKSSFSH